MGKTITVSYEGKPCYEIEIQHDFSLLADKLGKLGYGTNKVCIITDSNVAALYLEEVEALLSPMFAVCTSFVFEAGESSKNTDTVGNVYEHLIEHKFDLRQRCWHRPTAASAVRRALTLCSTKIWWGLSICPGLCT